MERYIKLGNAFNLIGGGTPSTNKTKYWGTGVPWISSADIDTQGKIRFRRSATKQGISESTTNVVPSGTVIVVTRVGLGKVAKTPCEMCFSQDIQALLAKHDLELFNTDFLMYQLSYIMQQLKYKGRGTTISGITKKQLCDIELYSPPKIEQERIVTRIDELFSQLDSGVATLITVKQQLEVYRQAVLKEAFEGTLTGVKPYTVKGLGEYIEPPRYGTSKKCSYNAAEGHIQVYRIPNIDHAAGQIEHSDIKYAAFTEQELEGIKLKEGDILIIRSNGSISLVGRAAMVYDVDTNGTFAGYLMRLRIRDIEKMKPKYLLWFLHSHSARIYIEGKAKSTSGVHNINSKEISELPIPLFSPTEQVQIVQTTETRLSICGSIEQTVDTALQQAEAMRKSILKQAFGGG